MFFQLRETTRNTVFRILRNDRNSNIDIWIGPTIFITVRHGRIAGGQPPDCCVWGGDRLYQCTSPPSNPLRRPSRIPGMEARREGISGTHAQLWKNRFLKTFEVNCCYRYDQYGLWRRNKGKGGEMKKKKIQEEIEKK